MASEVTTAVMREISCKKYEREVFSVVMCFYVHYISLVLSVFPL